MSKIIFKRILFTKLLFLIIIFYSCGEGLSPEDAELLENSGFSGRITFTGNWPDSVTRTHLVVFKDPLNSPGDFNILNLKYISELIPTGSAFYNYNSLDTIDIIDINAGEYSYVAVAQQKTIEVSLNRKDWYVVGVYYFQGDTTKPGKLVIPENTLVRNINILCDFNNPPPQPPGG
jgi:hypothetical protein